MHTSFILYIIPSTGSHLNLTMLFFQFCNDKVLFAIQKKIFFSHNLTVKGKSNNTRICYVTLSFYPTPTRPPLPPIPV